MSKPDSPCKNCKKRQFRCHSMCIEYAAFCFENREYRQKVFAQKKAENELDVISIARSDRANKIISRAKKIRKG